MHRDRLSYAPSMLASRGARAKSTTAIARTASGLGSAWTVLQAVSGGRRWPVADAAVELAIPGAFKLVEPASLVVGIGVAVPAPGHGSMVWLLESL